MQWAGSQPAGAPSGRGPDRLRGRSDDGFSLLELMIVVLVLGVLLGIAIPTLLGARERAANRKAQAHVRLTYVTQTIVATEARAYSDDPATLTAVDASISYTDDLATITAAPSEKTVFVDVATETDPDDTILVAARSASGRCFWLRANLKSPVSFATNDCSAAPAAGDLKPRW